MRELVNTDSPVVFANQDPVNLCKNSQPMEKVKNGSRNFRNPPQPHMCIQDYLVSSKEPCYINVLSWTKISTPRRPDDPIPLYGGMRIHQNSLSTGDKRSPTSSRRPPIFAVMANPEILRISGKTATDPMDQAALVDLMLDFVEAMNPEVKFQREFSVLKDRDLTGELKDIWMAIQVKREREREIMKRGEWRERMCVAAEQHDGVARRDVEDPDAKQENHKAPRHVVQKDVFPSSSDSSEDEDKGEVSCSKLQNGVCEEKAAREPEDCGRHQLLSPRRAAHARKQSREAASTCQDENVANNSQDHHGSSNCMVHSPVCHRFSDMKDETANTETVTSRPLEKDSILTSSMKEQVMRMAQL